MDASTLAVELGCERTWIYENRGLLESATFKLGAGPRPRLRFDVELARQALAAASEPPAEPAAPVERPRAQRRPKAAPVGSILVAKPRRRRARA